MQRRCSRLGQSVSTCYDSVHTAVCTCICSYEWRKGKQNASHVGWSSRCYDGSFQRRSQKMFHFGEVGSLPINKWIFYHYHRCDSEAQERPPVFKQLLALDQKKKMSDRLSDKLIKSLRHLLIEKEDLAERLCDTGSTSACESNHARIVNRGYYVKG